VPVLVDWNWFQKTVIWLQLSILFLFFINLWSNYCNYSVVELNYQWSSFWCSVMSQVGCKLYVKNTNWLSTLFHSEFFDSCGLHQEHRKNEKNVFCIDCRVGCCRHCMESHFLHRQFQICKYVYHDVVRLQEIQKHLDCSKIQVFI